MAAAAFHGNLLYGGVPRPRKCELRQALDVGGPPPLDANVCYGRGDFLPGIFLFRSAFEPSSGACRSPYLDRPHHAHVGCHFALDDVRDRQVGILFASLPPGRGGGCFSPGLVLYITYWFPKS